MTHPPVIGTIDTIPQPVPVSRRPTTVYRAFDAQDRLLYVGCTTRWTDRLMQHAGKTWWRDVARVTLVHFEDHQEGLRAEGRAQEDENPVYNIIRNGRRPARPPRAPLTADELAARREARMHQTHYRVGGGFACGNCGWDGNWVPKGRTLEEAKCPKCHVQALKAAA